MFEKQKQEAGANSQQIQAGTIIFNGGIDEKRAREIVDEKLHEVMNSYSQEAHSTAISRINQFANDLIPKLVKEELLGELKDPSIQILLSAAQKAAASTERPADYELLSELLIHRVKKGSDRNIRAGVSRAVKIIDEISDEALLGLTVAHSVRQFTPITGSVKDGLKALDDLFGKISYDLLPVGIEWINHLEILNAVRINSFGSLKKINQFYSEKLSGYINVGIDKSTDNFQKAITIAKEANLPDDILCDHELKEGYVRLSIPNINNLEMVVTKTVFCGDQNGKKVQMLLPFTMQLSDEQITAVKRIHALYSKDTTTETENSAKFMNLWDEFENLKMLKNWWDSIPVSFEITSIGRVLAHANAQRCDPTLPAMD